MGDRHREKVLAAEKSLAFIQDGMIVGLGTGSTADIFIDLLAGKVAAGLNIRGIPTSHRTLQRAQEKGIPMTDFSETERIDVTVDGTDEFDPELNLIKGGGGALLREKIVAGASSRYVIICDVSKQVDTLGAFPLPVEVVPFGWQVVATRLKELGASVRLRRSSQEEPFRTAEGNFILDASFGSISDPAELAKKLDATVGIVEHGLFVGMADVVLVGDGDSVTPLTRQRS